MSGSTWNQGVGKPPRKITIGQSGRRGNGMSDKHSMVMAAARRHGLSEECGQVLFDAFVRGGGRQAQFSHPDLGGMGQWSGGMVQIGDMFNDALKAKVGGFCRDLSEAAQSTRADVSRSGPDTVRAGVTSSPWAVRTPDHWWPASLGEASSTGAQNGMSYACFPDRRRLAITRDGKVTVYDTGAHRLSGFSQQQSVTGTMQFSSQDGVVALDSFSIVRE